MPTADNCLPDLPPKHISRRQARVAKLRRHFDVVGLGQHLVELDKERRETCRLLRDAAKRGDWEAYTKLAATMANVREAVFRVVGLPFPPKARPTRERKPIPVLAIPCHEVADGSACPEPCDSDSASGMAAQPTLADE